MKLSSTKFFILFLFYFIEWTLGVYYLPQRSDVTYVNEKYVYNGTSFIKRYGRKSPYYYNIEGGIKHTWGNNVTIHIVFFESVQLNQYKRNFFEIHLKLCDMLEHDPYLGKAVNFFLYIRGISCPVAPGMYKLHNLTLPNMPNILAFERGKMEVTVFQLPTNDVIAKFYIIFVAKEKSLV